MSRRLERRWRNMPKVGYFPYVITPYKWRIDSSTPLTGRPDQLPGRGKPGFTVALQQIGADLWELEGAIVKREPLVIRSRIHGKPSADFSKAGK